MFTTEQMVASIALDVLGDKKPITSQDMIKIAYELGRRKGDHRAMALFCEHFLMAIKNCNYDFNSNGERMILERFAGLNMKTLFDVGANEGGWSRIAQSLMPDADIHAFEIVDDTFRVLTGNVAGSAKIHANNFGLFAHDGEITMHVYEASNTFASHMPYPHGASAKKVCRVRSGDSYMREQGIERIDFLKLDAEGAESDILKGFISAFEAGRIDVVQFEYGRVNIMTHFLLRDFYEFFEKHGYAVGKIFPDFVDFRAYALTDEDFLGPNYLACRRQRMDLLELLGHKQA